MLKALAARISDWRNRRPLAFGVSVSAMASFLVNGVLFGLVHWYVVSPIGYGGVALLWLVMYGVMFQVFAFLAVPVALVALLVRRVRQKALLVLLSCLVYFPKQNYPARGYGGVIERVGDWAYVHE